MKSSNSSFSQGKTSHNVAGHLAKAYTHTKKTSLQPYYGYIQADTKPQSWRVNKMTKKDENRILKLEPLSNSVQDTFPKLRFPKWVRLKAQRDICFQVFLWIPRMSGLVT